MKNTLKSTVVLVSCICMCACTSVQVVASGQEQSQAYSRTLDKTHDGNDTLYIMTKDGMRYEVKVKDFNTDGFNTANADGTKQHIEADQIASIERNEYDSKKSAGLTAAIIGGLLILGTILARSAVNDMFKKSK